ncbi:MAG: DUF1700 domain-containing protein [Spirochaetes bacterium]|nr:DUF1700 domain-containing protein [Spirochaetota bacterium]
MTEKLNDYLNKIRKALHSWAPENIDDAVSYYKEFIEDALEQGLPEDQILNRLGTPEQIIKTIKAENNIRKTEGRPGPIGLLKSILGIPALKISIVLGGIIPIVTAYLLYILAVVSYISIAGGVLVSVYAVGQINHKYVWSVIGMIGLALITASVFAASGFLIWRIANIITRYTMKLLRRFLNKDRNTETTQPLYRTHAAGEVRKVKKVLSVFLIIFAAGVVMLIPSGLPARYFSIWNSQMPANYTEKEMHFPSAKVKTISITTLNSKIILKKTASARLAILYQQPDWMKGDIKQEGSDLSFKEKPNGRLPYMQFISRHEGMTSVLLLLPQKNNVDTLNLRTNGGTVELSEQISADYNISAAASPGKIILDNKELKSGTLQHRTGGKGTIYIKSNNGAVIINLKVKHAE